MTNPPMPFGKYRGNSVSEVFHHEPSYLAWFCGNVDGNEELKRAIRALAGRPEPFRKCLASRAQPARGWAEETFCIDPRLSREDLDRLCREILNLRRTSERCGRGCGNESIPTDREASRKSFRTSGPPSEEIPRQRKGTMPTPSKCPSALPQRVRISKQGKDLTGGVGIAPKSVH